jgi:hypothetical protein
MQYYIVYAPSLLIRPGGDLHWHLLVRFRLTSLDGALKLEVECLLLGSLLERNLMEVIWRTE